MKTILILGDSWGVPNYYGKPGVPHHCHTEYLLRNLGYKVYNCSINGGGNIETIIRAKEFVKGTPIEHPGRKYRTTKHRTITIDEVNPNIDWILWFHTEFFRDEFYSNMLLEDLLSITAKNQYKMMADFKESLNSKIAVIGGQCPVRDEIFDFFQPDFIIKDWRSEIVEIKLPLVFTLAANSFINRRTPGKNWIDAIADNIETKTKILDDHLFIFDVMQNSPDFPDGCHPGKEPHKKLVDRLDPILKI